MNPDELFLDEDESEDEDVVFDPDDYDLDEESD